jgi:glucoamylase
MRLNSRLTLSALIIVIALAGCRPAATPAPTAAAASAAPSTPGAALQPTAGTAATAQPVQTAAPALPAPAATTAAPAATTAPVPAPTSAITPTGTAFGSPAVSDFWTRGDKLGVGTAYTYDRPADGKPAPSRVWFALTGGAITELEYPTVDRANVRELSLLVTNTAPGATTRLQRELEPRAWITPTVEYIDPQALAYRVTTRDPGGAWQAVKEVLTDPANDALVTRWQFSSSDPNRNAYAYFVPHLGGAGRHDDLTLRDGVQVAWDEQAGVYTVVMMDPAPARASVGYPVASDGLADLRDDGTLDWTFDRLPKPGYPAATLALPKDRPVTLVVGFGASEASARAAASAALARGFDAVASDYVAGWHKYVAQLKAPSQPDPLYWVSAMVLKAHEDKTYPGAAVASLSAPWGQCLNDYKSEQGYRYVWPRDLYHVGQAFIALEDRNTARHILEYMDVTLQKPDGSFPQNVSVDGTPRWNALQMDQTADPILLAAALDAQDFYARLVKPAADFIAKNGPSTQQERWEENGGYSPATIAAQIAGLNAAAAMADKATDPDSAKAWRATADAWSAQLDGWTFTTNGPYSGGRYYLRLTPNGKPDDAGQKLSLTNGSGAHPMQEVVDVSFLELVRLGVRAPSAPSIQQSLGVVDAKLRSQTPAGPAWRRYTFDAYGETQPGRCGAGQGQLWPLFDGERGMYALAAGKPDEARALLATMRKFANASLLLPEQVFSSGAGTGSATPLVWAHAEYIELARSIDEGKVLDRPAGVAERYAGQ